MTTYLQMNGTTDVLSGLPNIVISSIVIDGQVDSTETYNQYLLNGNGYIARLNANSTNAFFANQTSVSGFTIGTRCTTTITFSPTGADTALKVFQTTKGRLYDIKIYNGANLLAHYDMSTGTVLDQSGNGRNATLTGGTWVSSSTNVPLSSTVKSTSSQNNTIKDTQSLSSSVKSNSTSTATLTTGAQIRLSSTVKSNSSSTATLKDSRALTSTAKSTSSATAILTSASQGMLSSVVRSNSSAIAVIKDTRALSTSIKSNSKTSAAITDNRALLSTGKSNSSANAVLSKLIPMSSNAKSTSSSTANITRVVGITWLNSTAQSKSSSKSTIQVSVSLSSISKSKSNSAATIHFLNVPGIIAYINFIGSRTLYLNLKASRELYIDLKGSRNIYIDVKGRVGMTEINQNDIIYAGKDYVIRAPVTDDDGKLMDFTGASATWGLRQGKSSTSNFLVKNSPADITFNGNTIYISLNASDTVNLKGIFYHECGVVDANGKKSLLFEGYLEFKNSAV